MTISCLSENKSFEGWHKQFEHTSNSLNCTMRFAIYLPPQVNNGKKVPVMYWLSGLSCTDENFMQKAGAHAIAAELGMAIVAPDTSPRGEGVADDENQAYDLGLGAGFYLNATQAPWKAHYHMYDYIVDELPALVEANFPVNTARSISGHSMGGHGALSIALRNPQRYCSVSAFSPISNPINCPWGQKAFTAYLGDDQTNWKQYDSCELIKTCTRHIPALVDQGLGDAFIDTQLMPDALQKAAASVNYPLQLNTHEGYDHGYYFISSFIEQHLRFHAGFLKA